MTAMGCHDVICVSVFFFAEVKVDLVHGEAAEREKLGGGFLKDKKQTEKT